MSNTLLPILRGVQRRLIRNAENAGRSWELEGSPVLETLLDDRQQLQNLQSFLEGHATDTPELLKVGPRRLVVGLGDNVGKIDLYPSPVSRPPVSEILSDIAEDPEAAAEMFSEMYPQAVRRQALLPILSKNDTPLARAEIYDKVAPLLGYPSYTTVRGKASPSTIADIYNHMMDIMRLSPGGGDPDAFFDVARSDRKKPKIYRNTGLPESGRPVLFGMRDYPFRY